MIERHVKKKAVKNLANLLIEARKIVITCHVKPDGDAIGSTLALMHVFSNLKKEAIVITPDTPPSYFGFLPGFDDIVVYSTKTDEAEELITCADVIFSLDYNAVYRVDRMAAAIESARGTKVLIDHHLDPEPFCDITISSPEDSSTCLLLYKVICALGFRALIDETVATCLATGIMTDTGNLSYNANDPDIYTVMADLLSKGIDKVGIWEHLNEKSENQIRLTGYALSEKLEIILPGKCALITLTREELLRYHYQKGDTEGLVNVPLQIPEVKLSVFMHEEPGFIKVSMRSKGDLAANEICEKHFGGGGHMNAAGGEFRGSMEEAVNTLKKVLPGFLK